MFRTVTWCIYAVLFAVLYAAAVRNSALLGYPTILIGLGGVSAVLSFAGVIAYAFEVQDPRVRWWARVIFPLFVFEVALGALMDALLPEDYNLMTAGLVWLTNLAFGLVLFGPAFYANFRLAYPSTVASKTSIR